jgi:hypothetical protein
MVLSGLAGRTALTLRSYGPYDRTAKFNGVVARERSTSRWPADTFHRRRKLRHLGRRGFRAGVRQGDGLGAVVFFELGLAPMHRPQHPSLMGLAGPQSGPPTGWSSP